MQRYSSLLFLTTAFFIYTQKINGQSLLFVAAITTPAAIVSAYDVIYEGFYASSCEYEVNYANFTAPYNCDGFDLYQISSYKLYYIGVDDCAEGTSLQITFYGQEGDGEVCGYDELLVLSVGDSQDCVEGLDITPANAEVTCA